MATAVTTMAAATERAAEIARGRSGGRRASGPDRLTVLLLTIAAFLLVLALLASQIRAADKPVAARPVVVLRKVYETRYVESVPSTDAAGGGTSVTQSVSSSSSSPAAGSAAPTTRSS
jgi:hypothetical protein